MRIRSIKPEFWRSDDIAALSIEDRLLFIGLWSYVDDSGVGVDKPALIAADLFALDMERDFQEAYGRVTGGLDTLSDRGLITRYTVHGKPFLYVNTWTKHQRIEKPSKPRYPAPTCEDAVIREGSGNTPVALREESVPGAGEQGSRGAGEQVDAQAPTTPPEALALCEHLADRIEGNGSKRPTIGKGWHDAARLLLDRDGRDLDDAHRLIDWCQDSDFWRGNILSMPKFREKYDQLRLQAENVRAIRPTGTTRPAGVPEGW